MNLLRRFGVVAGLTGLASANPMFGWNSDGNVTMMERSTIIAGQADIDITTMAAVGDSYSAGIGAGDILPAPNDGKLTPYLFTLWLTTLLT